MNVTSQTTDSDTRFYSSSSLPRELISPRFHPRPGEKRNSEKKRVRVSRYRVQKEREQKRIPVQSNSNDNVNRIRHAIAKRFWSRATNRRRRSLSKRSVGREVD